MCLFVLLRLHWCAVCCLRFHWFWSWKIIPYTYICEDEVHITITSAQTESQTIRNQSTIFIIISKKRELQKLKERNNEQQKRKNEWKICTMNDWRRRWHTISLIYNFFILFFFYYFFFIICFDMWRNVYDSEKQKRNLFVCFSLVFSLLLFVLRMRAVWVFFFASFVWQQHGSVMKIRQAHTFLLTSVVHSKRIVSLK